MNLGYGFHKLDFVLPTTDISIKSFSRYLRDLFGWNFPAVTGEMLYHKSENKIFLRLRFNSTQIFDTSKDFSAKTMNELFNEGGDALTKRIDPFALAYYHYFNSESEKAKDVVNFIIEDVNHDEKDYVRAVNLKGVMHYDNKQYDEAIREYERAIEFDRSFIAPYYNWGAILVKRDDNSGAIKMFMDAIEIDPKNDNIYIIWGYTLMKIGDYTKAIDKYTKAIELNHDNEAAYVNWGITLMRSGDYTGAIEKIRKATELKPKNADFYVTWGVALAKTGDYPGAIEKFRNAIELDPKKASAYFNWGIALTNKQYSDLKGAIEKFRIAIKVDPEYVKAYTYLSNAYKTQGKDEISRNLMVCAHKIDTGQIRGVDCRWE